MRERKKNVKVGGGGGDNITNNGHYFGSHSNRQIMPYFSCRAFSETGFQVLVLVFCFCLFFQCTIAVKVEMEKGTFTSQGIRVNISGPPN